MRQALLALALLVPVLGLNAQDVGTLPAFEVASIKPNKGPDTRTIMRPAPGGRWTATNMTVRALIRMAHTLRDPQIVGGPGWISSDRFDIVAKAESEITASQLLLMVQTLLKERFRLAVHNESRALPIYALVLAKTDGKLGPNLRRSEIDCAALLKRPIGDLPRPLEPGKAPPCLTASAPGRISANGSTMEHLAAILSPHVERIVRDRTGVDGEFDLTVQWTPDQLRDLSASPGLPPDTLPQINGVPLDPNGPSIFTALQEQLGLKLESQVGPVDVLVIDSVEQPTPD